MRKSIRHLLGVVVAASLMTMVAFAILLTLTPTPMAMASLKGGDDLVNSSLVRPASLAAMLQIQARRVISPDMKTNPNLSDKDRLIGVTGLEIQARRVISPTP